MQLKINGTMSLLASPSPTFSTRYDHHTCEDSLSGHRCILLTLLVFFLLTLLLLVLLTLPVLVARSIPYTNWCNSCPGRNGGQGIREEQWCLQGPCQCRHACPRHSKTLRYSIAIHFRKDLSKQSRKCDNIACQLQTFHRTAST